MIDQTKLSTGEFQDKSIPVPLLVVVRVEKSVQLEVLFLDHSKLFRQLSSSYF